MTNPTFSRSFLLLFTTFLFHDTTTAFSSFGNGSLSLPRRLVNRKGIISNSQTHTYHGKHSTSLIMSSLNGKGKKENQSSKRRRLARKLNPVRLILSGFNKANKMKTNFVTKFKSLSKKGKLLFSIQLFTLMLVLGTGTKQIIRNVRGNSLGSVSAARSRPVEVPYSVFMDFVEKSGKVR